MEFFDVVGSFGPWQRRVFVVFWFVNMLGIFQNFSITFLAPNMDFRCVEPASWQGNSSADLAFDARCEVLQEDNATVKCTRWEYDLSETSETIVSKWDLVCDQEWLISLTKSVYMVGFLLSVSFFGLVSDCLGRFPALVMCYVINIFSMFGSLLSTSYIMFIVLRFFQAFGRAGITTIGYVLVMETVGPKHRAEVGIAVQLGWSTGFVSLAAVVWFIRDWFWLQLFLSCTFLPFLLTYNIVPESPRWLAMHGKTERLEKLMTKVAALNGKELKGDIRDMDLFKDKKEKTETLWGLLKKPKMRNRFLKMIYLWMVNAFLYYGVSYNTNDLAGNPYLNFFVAGVVEFPCRGLVLLSIKWWGRRPTISCFMGVCSAAFGAMLLVPQDVPWLSTTLAMVGKFCVTGSFSLLYLYTTEAFPTVVRNIVLGSCSMCARFGSILAPFSRELGRATHPFVPIALYAVLSLSGSLLTLLLPETRGQEMPDSLQDGEDLGKIIEKKEQDRTSSNAKQSSTEMDSQL